MTSVPDIAGISGTMSCRGIPPACACPVALDRRQSYTLLQSFVVNWDWNAAC